MKVRQTFCAFTKFRKLIKALNHELNMTTKGMQVLQKMTDVLISKYIRLIYETQGTKTLRAKHLVYVQHNLRFIGVSDPPYVKAQPYYSSRLGHHVVKKIHPKYRIGKDAGQETYKLYVICLNELLLTLQSGIIDSTKRLTPDRITNILKTSKLCHIMV